MGSGRGIKNTVPGLGSGIRAGEFVLQPRFFVEGQYRTNFFKRSADSTTENEIIGAFTTHLRPGIALLNPNFRIFAISLSVDLNAQLPISDDEFIKDQKDVGVQVRAVETLFPKSALTFIFEEVFNRQLFTKPAGDDRNADRNHLRGGSSLAFHPGGRALELQLGYRYDRVWYEGVSENDTERHDFSLSTTLRFLPKSFVFLDARWNWLSYTNPSPLTEGAVGYQVSGKPLKLYGGLTGFLTERISLMLRGGYGMTMLDPAGGVADFGSFVGEARATLRFSDRTVLHLGAARDFENSTRGGFFSFIRGYTSFEKGIGSMVLLHLDVAFDHREFGFYLPPGTQDDDGNLVATTPSAANRMDEVIRAGLFLDINFVRMFGVSVGYRYETDITDYHLTTVFDGESVENHFNYDEHRIFATLNLRY